MSSGSFGGRSGWRLGAAGRKADKRAVPVRPEEPAFGRRLGGLLRDLLQPILYSGGGGVPSISGTDQEMRGAGPTADEFTS